MLTFSEIIGQNSIIEHLSNALRTGNVSHAYILCGDTGTGRKSIANAFAAALQCEDLQWEDGLPKPCGKCLSCLQAESGNQPDIITVLHEKPASIGVDEIRRMRSDIQIRPYANPHKVYIIPDAEKMTVQAQNAILKTLEEPPAYAVLILIASGTETFLPTILSRCVLLRTKAVSEGEIEKFLKNSESGGDLGNIHQNSEKANDSDAGRIERNIHLAARFAGGSPGRALQLMRDEEFIALRDRTIELLRGLKGTDIGSISAFVSELEAPRREDFMNMVLMWYRDVLVYRETGAADNLIFGDDLQYIIEAADALSAEALGRIADVIDEAARRLNSNAAADAVLETMLLRIRGAYR